MQYFSFFWPAYNLKSFFGIINEYGYSIEAQIEHFLSLKYKIS